MKEVWKELYDKVSKPAVKTAVALGLSANQISLFNHFMTLTAGGYFFSRGTYWGFVAGLGVCLINGFLDYLDGSVAREKGTQNKLGVWLDSGFDVVVQNAVMGAIAIGCFKSGVPLVWIIIFMIGNAASNFVSFNYNEKFGFSSDSGNELFRQAMSRKGNFPNPFFKGLVDPTIDYFSLCLYTYRYWIAVGAVIGLMPWAFMMMTLIVNMRWFLMYCIYAFYLSGDRWLYIFQVLALLDDERQEYYRVRGL